MPLVIKRTKSELPLKSQTKPPLKFSVDARTVLTLGRDSIKDHTTAVVELVKNSYDADANQVDLEIIGAEPQGKIRISDNGDGMSEIEVVNNWLRIGYSAKRSTTITSKYNRRKTGEKGIGRLSADRLGSQLTLLTKANRRAAVGISVDWDSFDQSGVRLDEIQIPRVLSPAPKLPGGAARGTELIITELRQNWTADDIAKLYQELEFLTSPFSEIASKFKIHFSNDVSPELNGEIEPQSSAVPDVEIDADVSTKGLLRYKLVYRDPSTGKRRTVKGFRPWSDFGPTGDASGSSFVAGPLRVKLAFFPRTTEVLEASGLSLGQLRSFLDRNAGVKIYRDLIRVKPYGDLTIPEGDWLGLGERKARNPAGAGRKSFRVVPSQLVGAVFIGRDENPGVRDSSSREGLIENDSFKQLRQVVVECLLLVENRYHKMHLAENGDADAAAARAKTSVNELKSELSTLRTELADLTSNSSAPSSGANSSAMSQIGVVLEYLEKAEKDIEEIASQNTVYRGLATVGIASAVFGHETEISSDLVQGELTIAKLSLEDEQPDVDAALTAVTNAERYLRQVAGWGRFALMRVKKDKRRRQTIDVAEVVANILCELKRPLEESNIELRQSLKSVEAKTFAMDIEAILVNFVTNSYHFVKRKRAGRVIKVLLRPQKYAGKDGFELSVQDSGPGFPKESNELIWQPLYTTRQKGGTGLGLTIVRSAVLELGGRVSAEPEGALGGATFNAWLPKG